MSTENIKSKKKQSQSLLTSLPEELIIDIIAHAPRCNYPTLSLVSKHFKSLVASCELCVRRALLGCTEHCLYVLLTKFKAAKANETRWYTLDKKGNKNCLVPIPSLPNIGSKDISSAAVGSKIYMFGYIHDPALERSDAFSVIDYMSNTLHPLPSLPMPVKNTVLEIIDGKIYVIGEIEKGIYRVMVFDIETQMWEPEVTEQPGMKLNFLFPSCAVAGEIIYMDDSKMGSFVYGPKENKWESEDVLKYKRWRNACVVDDVIYCSNYFINTLKAYMIRSRSIGLHVVDKRVMIYTASYGGKLVVYFYSSYEYWDKQRDIWFAEIKLERRQGGEIWGNNKMSCGYSVI